MDKTGTDEPASRRIGAIDVGTNSIRLIVAEATADGSYRILDDERENTRLGRGLAATGKLAPEVMRQSAATIARMKRIAEGYGVELLRAVGTCAVREAANRDSFLALVQKQADVSLETVSAEEEARLAYLSVARAFDLSSLTAAVVDIGGGSTEVVLSSGGVVEDVYTLPLGAVRLTEQFGRPEESAADGHHKMRRAIRRVLKDAIPKMPFVPQLMIGTGGTFTCLAAISALRNQPSGQTLPFPTVRGYEMKRSEVLHLVDWLREMPLRSRAKVPGLSPERADIIVAGAAIVERLMKHLGVNRLQVHDRGIRDGLLLTMVRILFPHNGQAVAKSPDPMRSVRQFAAACGYEERHCRHVAYLAGEIFDRLAALFPAMPGAWNDPAHRLLLQAAAMLHDIGYLINYSGHHRHSYHLIVHSDLAGFSPRQLELVANVARYHRRAGPKAKHPNFARLPAADQEIVRRLAAILRLADGLDRNHAQNVRGLKLAIRRKTAHFKLEAGDDPAVDIWGALGKGRLFRKAFGLEPCFHWAAAQAAASPAARAGRHRALAGARRAGARRAVPAGLSAPSARRKRQNKRNRRTNGRAAAPKQTWYDADRSAKGL